MSEPHGERRNKAAPAVHRHGEPPRKAAPPLRTARPPLPAEPLDRIKPPRQWRRAALGPDTQTGAAGARVAPRSELPAAAGESSDETAAQSAGATFGTIAHEPAHEPGDGPAGAPELPPLPLRYGEDRLVLLVRDPWWAYAWWEVTDARLEAGRQQLAAPGRLVLRLYDVSKIDWDGANHHESFDIDIADVAGNWYLDLSKPGASFCAEIGFCDATGRFVPLVRSNTVTLPPDSVSNVIDEEWMIPQQDWDRMFEAAGVGRHVVGSGEVLRLGAAHSWFGMSSASLAPSQPAAGAGAAAPPRRRPVDEG